MTMQHEAWLLPLSRGKSSGNGSTRVIEVRFAAVGNYFLRGATGQQSPNCEAGLLLSIFIRSGRSLTLQSRLGC